MTEILGLLPVLAVAMAMNLIAGLYYNLGTRKLQFHRKLLLTGMLKAALVACLFIGASYCFEAVDLSSLGVTPVFIMSAAITLYVGKALVSLGKILGIQVTVN